MATNWQIGDKIQNRWEIHKILRGGMGIVYIVYDHEWREALAAKTFQDEVFAKNPETADRFTQEALSWVNLDVHQNVAQARLVGAIEGKPFLFLEYVSGGDLGGWIGTPRLTEDLPQVLRFAIQFCDGMTHALSRGIKAHRDIKPQNCLITEDNTLKVTDFGLAKVFDDASETSAKPTPNVQGLGIGLSRTGTAAGTCTHMAPEQFNDAKHVDVRADIYSFGVMLFQMITGQLPFIGRTWQEFEHLHKTQLPPKLTTRSPELETIVHTCIAKEPARRFANFSHVREQLAEIYEKLTGEAAPKPVKGAELNAVQLSNKGANLGNLGRAQEALTYSDRALEINPLLDQAWSQKGVSLGALGRHEEALTCFDRALKLNVMSTHAWSNKGVALQVLGRIKEAVMCQDHALELRPRYPEAWCNKGAALGALGRHEEALVCCDRALKLNLRYADARFNKGVALVNLRRYNEALLCFEETQRLGHPQAAQGIALCRQALGKG